MDLDEQLASARFNVFLGKNGSGKSTHLRSIDAQTNLNTKYISPERGGTLKYDPGVDQNIANNVDWLVNTRRKNRFDQFRQQSASQFRNLEMLVLREIEQNPDIRDDHAVKFDNTLDRINQLLPNVRLVRADKGFEIETLQGAHLDEDSISSGEAELVALCIEVLVFSRSNTQGKILLLDEPDVHLHPDLQQKYVAFVEEIAVEYDMKVVLATHSTAIIGAFSAGADLSIVPISSRDQTEFKSFRYDPICDQILPIFGAHPLSSQFNKAPVVLVEGDDDKRILDQVVRSGGGRFSFSPCVVGTVTELNDWEKWLSTYLPTIYDDPVGYSLRDLDNGDAPDVEDKGCVVRMQLNCYEAENLLLTDECFNEFEITPEVFLSRLHKWVAENPTHQSSAEIGELAKNFENRRTIKIKSIRNVLVALLETSKPWEVLVGQLIVKSIDEDSESEHALHFYLGQKVADQLFHRKKN